MKKLLLSTLIFTSSLMLAPVAGPGHLKKTTAPAAPAPAPAPAATTTTTTAANHKQITDLLAKVKKDQGPKIDRLKTLEANINILATEFKNIDLESLSQDAKNDLNNTLNTFDIEANDLWEQFGGSTLKWYYPSYQSSELKNITRHIADIKALYDQVNPTSIIAKPFYAAASWANRNKGTALFATWLAYRVGKGCYNQGFYPSSKNLQQVVDLLHGIFIG